MGTVTVPGTAKQGSGSGFGRIPTGSFLDGFGSGAGSENFHPDLGSGSDPGLKTKNIKSE